MKAPLVALLLLSASPALADETTTSIVPVDLPDAERRVILDFEIGFAPVFTGLTGQPDVTGMIPTDGSYQDSNLFLDGNAALGTRGILWPTLNLYGLGSGIFDLRGVPGTTPDEIGVSAAPAVNPSIAHRFGDARALFLHLAYVEMEGITQDGFLSDLHVRAGRQFHISRVGVTFDGVTLGYDGPHAKAAVRVGSRSSSFDRTQGDAGFLNGGLLVGGDLGWDFGEDFPLSIEAEVLHYRRTVALFSRDQPLEGGAETVDQRTTIGDLRIEYANASSLILTAAAELTFPALSHVRAGASFAIGATAFMIDFDQKIGRDLFYDLAGGEGLTRRDRSTTYETFRLNMIDPQPYSDLNAIVSIPLADWLDLQPTAGFRVSYGDQLESSPYDATHIRYGLTADASFQLDEGNGLEAQLGVEGIKYLRGEGADGNFRDWSAGGEDLSHEVSGGLRYVHGGGFRGRRLLSERSLSVGVQGFGRFARFANRYLADAVDEGAYGFGVDATWQFTRYTGVRLAYEFASDSSIFYDYLSAFHAVRVAVKGSF